MAVRVRGGRFMIDLRHRHQDGRVERIRIAASHCNSRRAAEAYERTVLAELKAGTFRRPGLEPRAVARPPAPTLAAFVAEFIEACRGRGNKPREIAAKEQILAQHLLPAFGRKPLGEIDEPVIDRYRDAKIGEGLAPKTVRNHLEVLRRALSIAHRRKMIGAVPTFEMPKRRKLEPNYLTFAEADAFIAEARGGWADVFLFAIRTGLRLGEIKGLRWRDIDLDRKVVRVRQQRSDDGTITTPKSGHGRSIDLSWDVLEMLRERDNAGEFVFGSLVTDRSAWWAVSTTAKRAGIERHVHPHDLRHTFASHAVMRGVDLITLKEWMGHSSIAVTEIYAHVCGVHRASRADLLAPPRPGLAVVGHTLGTPEMPETSKGPQSKLRAR